MKVHKFYTMGKKYWRNIRERMIFTIEPMINVGSYKTKLLNDGWTVVTQDHELSAQYEHTI